MLVNRVRSSAQTRGFYCKSKPKVGGWIKDPTGYRVRHCGMIIRKVFESDDVDEFMSVLDGQVNAEPGASDKATGGELFVLGDAFRP